MPETSDLLSPDWLAGDALKVWNALAPKLKKAGMLTEIDHELLAAYCAARTTAAKAQKMIDKKGEVTLTSHGNEIPSPWLGIRNTALKLMAKLAPEFGMSPSSRSRVSVDTPGDEDDELPSNERPQGFKYTG